MLIPFMLISCKETTTPEETAVNTTAELWVLDNSSDQISVMDPSDGTLQYRFSSPGGITSGDTNVGLAWDGEYIWLIHANSHTLYKCDLHGTVVQELSLPDIPIKGLTYANGFLWAAGFNELIKINPADGTWTTTPSPHGAPTGIAYDGVDKLWVVGNSINDEIYTYELSSGDTAYKFNSPDRRPTMS